MNGFPNEIVNKIDHNRGDQREKEQNQEGEKGVFRSKHNFNNCYPVVAEEGMRQPDVLAVASDKTEKGMQDMKRRLKQSDE